jgi:hypothetical protein
VVTDGLSDWSLALAPDWAAQRILIRVSRSGNALTIRAKPPDHDDLQLIPGRQSARQRGSRLVRHDCPSGGDPLLVAGQLGPVGVESAAEAELGHGRNC